MHAVYHAQVECIIFRIVVLRTVGHVDVLMVHGRALLDRRFVFLVDCRGDRGMGGLG